MCRRARPAALHKRYEGGRDVGGILPRDARPKPLLDQSDKLERFARELPVRLPPGPDRPQKYAEGKHVHLRAVRLLVVPRGDLHGHVRRGSDIGGHLLLVFLQPRHPEVAYLDDTILIKQNIVRLKIPMDDVPGMKKTEALSDL